MNGVVMKVGWRRGDGGKALLVAVANSFGDLEDRETSAVSMTNRMVSIL